MKYAQISLQDKELSEKEMERFMKKKNDKKMEIEDLEKEKMKIIAYRADTAMCNVIKKKMSNPEQARSLMRKLYSADADIEMDDSNHVLIVKIHNTNHWADDKILQCLCDNLNETQTVFPSTNLTIQFKLVTS